MERNRDKSLTIHISQLENRLSLNQNEEINLNFSKKIENLNNSASSSNFARKSIMKLSKNIPILNKKSTLKHRISLKNLAPEKQDEKDFQFQIKDVKFDNLQKLSEKILDIPNAQENNILQLEINKLQTECIKFEERARKYENKYNNLKIKTNELENEKNFLETQLKDALKDLKTLNTMNKKKDESTLSLYAENTVKKKPVEYNSKTEIGKYLTNLLKKYDQKSVEFLKEVEKLIEFKEFKLNNSIAHYKSIIENLKNKIKNNNLSVLSAIKMNDLGQFFNECVEDVKKDIAISRKTTKFYRNDKRRLLEMFLINENVMKIIHDNLIDYTRLSRKNKFSESFSNFPNDNEKLAIQNI